MKKLYYILFLTISCSICASANEIIADTSLIAKEHSYYLLYQQGNGSTPAERIIAVSSLAKGLSESDSGLRGQIIGYLQSFSGTDFDQESRQLIIDGLTQPDSPHFDKLILLAGSINEGYDELMQLYLKPGLPISKKWNIALALSRMGNEETTAWCLQKARKAPVNSAIVGYLLPDLIYTRQKAALDYCVELLFSDEKLCMSPNPDISEKIPCAYRIIELLAPVIRNFPIEVDPSIGLESDDYPKTLQTIREWFQSNGNYKIK